MKHAACSMLHALAACSSCMLRPTRFERVLRVCTVCTETHRMKELEFSFAPSAVGSLVKASCTSHEHALQHPCSMLQHAAEHAASSMQHQRPNASSMSGAVRRRCQVKSSQVKSSKSSRSVPRSQINFAHAHAHVHVVQSRQARPHQADTHTDGSS